jgi:hypothetical protein
MPATMMLGNSGAGCPVACRRHTTPGQAARPALLSSCLCMRPTVLLDADKEAEWILAEEEEEQAAARNLKRARHEQQVNFLFWFQILMSICLVTSIV